LLSAMDERQAKENFCVPSNLITDSTGIGISRPGF